MKDIYVDQNFNQICTVKAYSCHILGSLKQFAANVEVWNKVLNQLRKTFAWYVLNNFSVLESHKAIMFFFIPRVTGKHFDQGCHCTVGDTKNGCVKQPTFDEFEDTL